MTKIIYFSVGTLTPILHESLCIDYFRENGIKVLYLDLTQLLIPELKITHKYTFIEEIYDYKQLEKFIQENVTSDTLCNIQIHYENRFFKLFRLLKKYNCALSIFAIGYGPAYYSKNKLIGYLSEPKKLFLRIVNILITKLTYTLNLIPQELDIVFAAGEVAKENFKFIAKKIIEINYIDYEKFLKCNVESENEIIVFLDSYLAHHEDHKIAKYPIKLNTKKYMLDMNTFFKEIETTFGQKIYIAAHPKAIYKQTDFDNRKIFYNKTINLTSKSSLVLAHHSTSISFAVLYKKPIVFIYTNEIEKIFASNTMIMMRNLANFLNMPIINSEKEHIRTMPFVDEQLYDRYKYNYLTTKKAQIHTNKRIIKEFIESECNGL